jgi:pimeloyl-ACP methyl ester carboxylesterase
MKDTKKLAYAALSSAVLAMLAACSPMRTEPTAAPAPPLMQLNAQKACAAFVGTQIAATSIGLPTQGARVLAAEELVDTDTAGQARSYCKLTGNILAVDTKSVITLSNGATQTGASPIRFQVNLPKVWNQRAVQFGGGGTNGTVITGTATFSGAPANIATPLARGYITFGSDSGHSSAGLPPFDTSFAQNDEELLNFAHQQVKKTVDVAKLLAEQMYGQKPRYTYFVGGSQGGHEAFDAAQRYPQDYEGIVAHYPAYNLQNMWQGALNQAKAVYGNASGVASSAWSNPAKVAAVVADVLSVCDGLDGISDGIISNIPACNAAYSTQTLAQRMRCAGGADTGNSCLSDAQLGALTKIASAANYNFAFAGGSTSYPRWPLLEGGTFLGNHLGRAAVANPAVLPFGPEGTAFQYFPGRSAVTGFLTRDMKRDPLAFDPNLPANTARIQAVSAITDAVSLDYSRFTARGGKMLLTHGTTDDSITPHNTIAYWNKLVAAQGQDAVNRFARFYLIPGYGHGSGVFTARHDWLSTLEQWVEQGNAPAQLTAIDGNAAPATAALNGRTRPLCLFGTYPRYSGPANPSQAQANDAANFRCEKS